MYPQSRGFLIVLTLLALVACASQPAPPPRIDPLSSDATFPAPPELQPQIGFWRNVYATWGRGQVALHDDRHLDLVYGVLSLPGEIGESQTPEQQAFVKGHQENLRDILRQLEFKVTTGAPLTPAEQKLADHIRASSGGPGAVVGASDRLRTQRGMRERFKRGLEISGRYDAAFRGVFREAGLPDDLAYLPHVESSFQNHAASSAGAVGMWQFMPGTARHFGMLNAAVDERRDPVASAQGAARYLTNAHDRLGNWPLALTSYNHGVGGMKNAQQAFGNDFVAIVRNYSGKGFGFASRNFYTEFLAAREIARNPQRFFPEGVRYEPPLNLDRVRLRQAVNAMTLASYYEVNPWELTSLNKAWNPAAQNGRIELPAGTLVWLPAGTVERLVQRGVADRALALADPVTTTSRMR
ncbi:MAG: lytic transglycosylase domain-containing protein [Candidatus Contendobacter sp.]|nr:lytic transglycosylase domain-containing protein [Candidatus Contendobacter sp.]MDG4556197.1 lytic transglycosylase domain-containing protein [Candidatus Contendobacter sp.]